MSARSAESDVPPDVPPDQPARSVQPTLDGSEPNPSLTDADLSAVAFGIARGWIGWRREQNVPVVMRSPKSDPAIVVRNLVLAPLRAGYTEREIKLALSNCTGGIPSASQLDRALAEVRMGRGRPSHRAGGAVTSGANRHVDDLTDAQRDACNPFLLAVRSSDVPDDERGAA